MTDSVAWRRSNSSSRTSSASLQELSDVVYRQQREIESALEFNRQLRRQVEDLEGRSADPGAVEIPPHY